VIDVLLRGISETLDALRQYATVLYASAVTGRRSGGLLLFCETRCLFPYTFKGIEFVAPLAMKVAVHRR